MIGFTKKSLFMRVILFLCSLLLFFKSCSMASTSPLHSITIPKSSAISKDRMKTVLPHPHATSQSKYHDTVLTKTSSSSHSTSGDGYDDGPYYGGPPAPLPPPPGGYYGSQYGDKDYGPSWRNPHSHHGSESSWPSHHEGHYSHHNRYPFGHHKEHHDMLLVPVILGGFAVVLIPIMTLLLTLMVNIAPASNMPTAITTVGKRSENGKNSTEFMDLLRKVDDVIARSIEDDSNEIKKKD